MPNLQCLTKGTSTVLMGRISIIIGVVAKPRQPSVTCPVRMIRRYVRNRLPWSWCLDFPLAAPLNGRLMNILGAVD